MKNQVDISVLINSDRYQKVLEEVSTTIDKTVQSNPFSEPLLATAIGDNEALQLLDKETRANQEQFNDLYQIYQEIIEDTLYSQLELIPLEAKRDELWKSLSSSSFATLVENYNNFAREEAQIIAQYREELNNSMQSTQSLQNSVYETEESNKRVKRDLVTLEKQKKRKAADLEQEKTKTVGEIDDNDQELQNARQIEKKVSEMTGLLQNESKERDSLVEECEALKNEIEAMTEELVTLDKRSVAQLRTKTKGRK